MLGKTLTQQNAVKAMKFLKMILGSGYIVELAENGIQVSTPAGVSTSDGRKIYFTTLIAWGKKVRDVRKGYSD